MRRVFQRVVRVSYVAKEISRRPGSFSFKRMIWHVLFTLLFYFPPLLPCLPFRCLLQSTVTGGRFCSHRHWLLVHTAWWRLTFCSPAAKRNAICYSEFRQVFHTFLCFHLRVINAQFCSMIFPSSLSALFWRTSQIFLTSFSWQFVFASHRKSLIVYFHQRHLSNRALELCYFRDKDTCTWTAKSYILSRTRRYCVKAIFLRC